MYDDYDEDGEDLLEQAKAVQAMINSGSCWSMEGSVGRQMMSFISSGLCLLGTERARDYWGNVIPSRDDVKSGTKGSFDFVANARGEDWAQSMVGIASGDVANKLAFKAMLGAL
jgi:hypothetical protein